MKTPLSILIIEDIESDADLVVRELEKADYDVAYQWVETAEQLKAALKQETWDVIVADYQLPGFNAQAALQLLQATGLDIPFIVVSGAIGEETAVALMKAGACDYLMKGNLARLAPVVDRELAEMQARRERKQLEKALQQWADAFRHCAHGIAMGDPSTGRILICNPAFAQLHHTTVQNIVDQPILSIYAPEDHARVKNFHEESDRSGQVQFEASMRRSDGSVFPAQMDLVSVRDESGGLLYRVATMQDISKRKQAEDEIHQHYQELEIIHELLDGLTVQLNMEMILDRLVSGSLALTALESGMLFISDPQQQGLLLVAEKNVPTDLVRGLSERPIAFQECLCGQAAGTGQPVIEWANASGHPGISLAVMRAANINFYAALPLLLKGRCIGVLCVFARDERRPSLHSLDLLKGLCGSFALAIENAQLYESAHREAARAEALARTAARLIASLDLQAVTSTVCEEAARALDVPASNLILYDERQNDLKLAACFGFPAGYVERHQPLKLEASHPFARPNAQPVRMIDIRQVPNFPNAQLYQALNLYHMLSVRVAKENRLIGILNLFVRDTLHPSRTDDLALLQGLADQAAQAIDNARLFEQVSTGRKRLRALSRQLLEVQEAERRTMALELHDELGQMLNSIKMSLDMMPMLKPEAAHEQLTRAQALVSDLITRVRRMSLELRPSMLDDLGLLPALRWLFKNYLSQTGRQVTFDYSNIEQRFSTQVEITAYRITQEALTNVIRHAGGASVKVEVWADDQALNLQIVDQGQGFDPMMIGQKYESSGLSGMRERARLIGGELIIESEIGVGTTLTARLPFDANL